MLVRRLIAFALAMFMLAGCASAENPEPTRQPPSIPAFSPSTAYATAVAVATPAPTPSPSATVRRPPPTIGPLFPPTSSPSLPPPEFSQGLKTSDRFWETWYEDCGFGVLGGFTSLEEMTERSDLVVRGRIVDLHSEHRQRWDNAIATVAIDEVIKGEPVSREGGRIEVHLGTESDLNQLTSRLPAHDHLWFLRHEGARTPDDPSVAYDYYGVDHNQLSVLRGIGGVVRVIKPDWIAQALSRRDYPVPLEGTSFEELVERVRLLADEEAHPPAALARAEPERPSLLNRYAAC